MAAEGGRPAAAIWGTAVRGTPTQAALVNGTAGHSFEMDDLQITQEDNQLVIRGRQSDDTQGRTFLHRGIAARQFQRAFVLAEGIEIGGAWLDRGLLHIDLARPQPEVRVKRIEISEGGGPQGALGADRPRSVMPGKTASSGEIARTPPRPPRVVRSVAIED